MSMAVSMHQCWANIRKPDESVRRCLQRVPADPRHVGLCDRHIAELRGD